MDQPNAKPESRSRGISSAQAAGARRGTPAVRRYPKPPRFFTRLFLLCAAPEFWAQAARYPTYITLLPLLVAILLGAMIATTGQTYRQASRLWSFASTYDQYYPPMELTSDGTLRATAELKAPVRLPTPMGTVLVDPTGRTNPQTVAWDGVWAVVTDKDVYRRNDMESWQDQMTNADASTVVLDRQPITDFFRGAGGSVEAYVPEKGQVKVINGQELRHLLVTSIPGAAFIVLLWAFVQALGDVLWATLMIFLLTPVIMRVAAFRGEGQHVRQVLLLPRRAAVRMAAALTVPLVLLGAILRALGIWEPNTFAFMGRLTLWLLAGVGLAVWTGILARRMYGTQATR